MKRLALWSVGIFCGFCLMIATEQRAMAYVDPGSGLMVIQGAASVAAAVGYFFRRKLFGFFGKSETTKAPATTAVPAKRTSSRLA